MKISKYWSLSRGLGIYNFSAQIPPLLYYYRVLQLLDHKQKLLHLVPLPVFGHILRVNNQSRRGPPWRPTAVHFNSRPINGTHSHWNPLPLRLVRGPPSCCRHIRSNPSPPRLPPNYKSKLSRKSVQSSVGEIRWKQVVENISAESPKIGKSLAL